MTKPQLRALSIFGRSNSHATFEQAWFLFTLTSEKLSISHEGLTAAFDQLVSLGLLLVDHDGKVSLAGDEFEQTYIRYHAERAGVGLSIYDFPYSVALSIALIEALESFTGPVMSISPNRKDGAYSPIRAASALLDPQGGDIREEVIQIFEALVNAMPSGELIITRITLTYDGISAYAWLAFSPDNYIDLSCNASFAILSRVVEDNNGTLSSEEFRFVLPPEEEINARIVASGNNQLIRALANQHANSAAEEYLAGRYEIALWHTDRAAKFPLSRENANNIGYISLTLGNYDTADELFARAASSALKNDNFQLVTLAAYNRGIVHFMLGDRRSALSFLEEAKNCRIDHPFGSYPMRCLLVPTIISGKLVMQEVKKPELSATVDQALSVLTGLTNDETVPEVQLNDDLESEL